MTPVSTACCGVTVSLALVERLDLFISPHASVMHLTGMPGSCSMRRSLNRWTCGGVGGLSGSCSACRTASSSCADDIPAGRVLVRLVLMLAVGCDSGRKGPRLRQAVIKHRVMALQIVSAVKVFRRQALT
jgi:hypothetical protein